MADYVTIQMPVTIPIRMMSLAKGKSQGGSSADNNPPQLENIPARAGNPWPKRGSTSENFDPIEFSVGSRTDTT